MIRSLRRWMKARSEMRERRRLALRDIDSRHAAPHRHGDRGYRDGAHGAPGFTDGAGHGGPI